MAYGLLMNTKGFSVWWTLFASTTVFAGSMQFAGIALLTSAFNPVYAFLLTLMINARHIFYGIAMLKKYEGRGFRKAFMVFGLVDETFSINCSVEPPEGVDRKWFYFFITFLNYIYWVSYSVIGSLLGNLITFNTSGLDFVLTSLFVVIFIDQWRSQEKHTSAIIGLAVPFVCLLVFGRDNFIIPAMVLIIAALTVFSKRIKKEVEG
ncbi:MAG: AzlC family ABC transporter permease, partial [Acholeplasmataceae bacterium]